jgi:2-phosphosulfolactate phosphatase
MARTPSILTVWFDQDAYALRCEWGAAGITALAPCVDVLVIVDVLSFSTCVDVAISRGACVYPYPWKDASAIDFAKSVGAVLAGPRSHEQVSLSPVSLQRLTPGARVVLPSPNGATLSRLTGPTPTLTGCLRNAAVVARVAQSYGPRIGLVPAGERWPDGSLRPSLEDWLGAGAILSHLAGSISPEAELAREAFLRHSVDIAGVIEASASGRELLEQGWSEDVALATELGVSSCAPVLIDRAYRDCQARIGVAAI